MNKILAINAPHLNTETGRYFPRYAPSASEVTLGSPLFQSTITDISAHKQNVIQLLNELLIPMISALKEKSNNIIANHRDFFKHRYDHNEYEEYYLLLVLGFQGKLFDIDGVALGIQAMSTLLEEMIRTATTDKTKALLSCDCVNAYTLFAVSFMVSEKLHKDRPFNNRTWSQIIGNSVTSLNKIERAYLSYLQDWKYSAGEFNEYSLTIHQPFEIPEPPLLQRAREPIANLVASTQQNSSATTAPAVTQLLLIQAANRSSNMQNQPENENKRLKTESPTL